VRDGLIWFVGCDAFSSWVLFNHTHETNHTNEPMIFHAGKLFQHPAREVLHAHIRLSMSGLRKRILGGLDAEAT
jgi:hypothetical protein